MRISDLSSYVCSSGLDRSLRSPGPRLLRRRDQERCFARCARAAVRTLAFRAAGWSVVAARIDPDQERGNRQTARRILVFRACGRGRGPRALGRDRGQCDRARSEEHTSELQSLMRISAAVFCLTKKIKVTHIMKRQLI